MKTRNIIIGVLAVAVVTLTIVLFRVLPRTAESTKKSVAVTVDKSLLLGDDLRKKICAMQLSTGDGDIIQSVEAKDAIAEYSSRNPGQEVRAFHIGKETLADIMTKINAYNNTNPAPNNLIVGIRCYLGVTTRTFNGTEVPEKVDLIIYPSLADGDDYTGPIYSHTRPCPKLCGN